MNAQRIYFDRLDMIAERFHRVMMRRIDRAKSDAELTNLLMGQVKGGLGRAYDRHPLNTFIDCEMAVGVNFSEINRGTAPYWGRR